MTNGNDLIHSFNHAPDMEGNFKGLTKREYFAAMAMQGMSTYENGHTVEIDCKLAVKYADALINALNEQK